MSFGNDVRDHIARREAGMYALLLNWAGQLEGYAKSYASWVDRTAHARQSLHAGVDTRGRNENILYLSHGVEYGAILEEGAAPHEIKFKDKKALSWPGASHPVKKVMHPGSRPHAIVGPTADVHINRIKRTVVDYWRD